MQNLYYPVVECLRVRCLVFTSINQNCIADAYQREASHLDSPHFWPTFGEEVPGVGLGLPGAELARGDAAGPELDFMGVSPPDLGGMDPLGSGPGGTEPPVW